MDDRSLYAAILGLEAPWEVERVELRETEQVVHVWVRAQEGTQFVCPECREVGPIYDHSERSWRHLDTCQFQTLLHATVPRITCQTHGVRTVAVPWAERRSHFTLLFERLAIAWLKEATPLAVARRLGLMWEEANGIVERVVRRGLARRTSVTGRRLGIDEHSYLKHFQFVTMVVDLDTQHVLHVADDSHGRDAGALLREPHARGAGGHHRDSAVDAHQVSLAQAAGAAQHRHAARAPTPAPQHAQGGARVGAEGSVPASLGLPLDPRGVRLLLALGGVGASLAPPPHGPRGGHRPPAPREHPHVSYASDHERGDGRPERQDPVDQVFVARLPRPRAVEAGDLFPLWGPRSRPSPHCYMKILS